jgi:hypothetical protein
MVTVSAKINFSGKFIVWMDFFCRLHQHDNLAVATSPEFRKSRDKTVSLLVSFPISNSILHLRFNVYETYLETIFQQAVVK